MIAAGLLLALFGDRVVGQLDGSGQAQSLVTAVTRQQGVGAQPQAADDTLEAASRGDHQESVTAVGFMAS